MKRFVGLAVIAALVTACGPARHPRCPAVAPPNAPPTIASEVASSTPFATPVPLPCSGFVVLGPFASPGEAGSALEQDYLGPLGGELAVSLTADSEVTLADGRRVTAREAKADEAGIVDLVKLYERDTNQKVAYAAGEVTAPRALRATARFGSDDGATVWVNGKQVHHIVAGRPINPDDDQFGVDLEPGKNRVLIKVENGFGGWAFALRFYDAAGAEQLATNDLRRHLESLQLEPPEGDFALGSTFPDLGWTRVDLGRRVFALESTRVRWFGPDLTEVTTPQQPGRYVAVVTVQTLDGFTHRRMLTFSKLAQDPIPRFPEPPYSRAPTLDFPLTFPLNDSQMTELSQYFWSGARQALTRGEQAAIARLAIHELGEQSPPEDEPTWLHGGFVRNAEYQLRLRAKLEGRRTKPLAAPQLLEKPARALRPGSEVAAGMKPGTRTRLSAVARDWAAEDPNGFVVLVARHGVVFMHEGFNGFDASSTFWPASIGKTIAAFIFAQAVDQGRIGFDDPVGTVLPEWAGDHTKSVTFRHCFYHTTGLTGHVSHGGLFNPYLDGELLSQDAAFTVPGSKFFYNGDDLNLAGKALEALTGKSVFRLLYEQMQRPFGEDVTQFDLGVGDAFTASYVAKVGQMVLGGGQYGDYQIIRRSTLDLMLPQRTADFAPNIGDPALFTGIGLGFMPDPAGDRENGVLGPNVLGHGSASGSVFRIDRDHDLVVVVGRNQFRDYTRNDAWAARFMSVLASGLKD